MQFRQVETALFGRALLTLQLSGGRAIPPTRLSPGTTVALRPSDSKPNDALPGTLTRVSETSVNVSIDELPDEPLKEPLMLLMLHNEVHRATRTSICT